MMDSLGKGIFIIGLVLVVVGLVLWFGGDKLGWLGNLPGDIKVERPGFRFYAPITTMIILSIVLSLVLWLLGRLFR
jgi:uncharacterized membrane protein